MKLPPAEQGRLNGLFEVHFGITLRKGQNISIEQCEQWNAAVTSFLLELEMNKVQPKPYRPKKTE